jgi:hypothetical protein
MSVILLHADTTGTDSIQDVIDAHRIEYIPIPNFEVYERACLDLLHRVGPNDTVILDTISQMGHIVRGDIKLGVDPEANLWELRRKYMGDTDNWGTYTAAANLIMRRLKNLYNRGASIVTTCHENESVDPADYRKKRSIALNKEFREMVDHCSSDIFRLSEVTESLIDPNTGATLLEAGSRLLQIRRSEEVYAKIQVTIAKNNELRADGITAISNPTWAKMVRVIGKHPRWLTLYGLTGVGKTNFVVRRGAEIQTNPNLKGETGEVVSTQA